MKKNDIGFLTVVLTLGLFAFSISGSFGDTEIDLGDSGSSAPATAAAPTPVPTVVSASAATPTPAGQEIEMEDDNGSQAQPAPTPTQAVLEVHGVLKMKDVYEAGVSAYNDKDYLRAIRYWTKAVRMSDPYTPRFYYAEAYSMLGVIYQYHIIHYDRAYRCYQEALKYERRNPTARRHIKQVYKYRHRKD